MATELPIIGVSPPLNMVKLLRAVNFCLSLRVHAVAEHRQEQQDKDGVLIDADEWNG